MVAPCKSCSKMAMTNMKVLLNQRVPIAPDGSFSTPFGPWTPVAFSAARKAWKVARPCRSPSYQLRAFLMLFAKSMRAIFIAGPNASRIRTKASAVCSNSATPGSGASESARKPRKMGSRMGSPETSSGPSRRQSPPWSKAAGMRSSRTHAATSSKPLEVLFSSEACTEFGVALAKGGTCRSNRAEAMSSRVHKTRCCSSSSV
mmetsp:Transcript_133635/g.372561  ORF Transcript_133635/g.372561 Transcript_133635/m.372561 type:complete len:203 (-) Transcript_133635:512-1120(-)